MQALIEAAVIASIPAMMLAQYTGSERKTACIEALTIKARIERWKAEDKCNDADNIDNSAAVTWLVFTLAISPMVYIFGDKN